MNQNMMSSNAVLLVPSIRAARLMAAAAGSPHLSCSHWELLNVFKDKDRISNSMMLDQGGAPCLGIKPAREGK
jgi:hypothetical protein